MITSFILLGRCRCRKIEEMMKLKLMMEDLMEGMGWIKYLMRCFGGVIHG